MAVWLGKTSKIYLRFLRVEEDSFDKDFDKQCHKQSVKFLGEALRF